MADLAETEHGVRVLHAHYTDAVFRKDADAFAECFAADGEWRIAGRVFRGRPAIRDGICAIMDTVERVLISFRTPLLHIADGEVAGRTYVDERCAYRDGSRAVTIGRYYERFTYEGDRWHFSWRLCELLYRGDADLTGTFFDQPDYGPPPAMPPRDAGTRHLPSPRSSEPSE